VLSWAKEELFMSQEDQISTPAHAVRARASKAAEEAKKEPKILSQWGEVVKRSKDEDGKVLLITQTEGGYKHSLYVGRESKSQTWLEEQKKKGLYKPFDGRKGGR
jgi:hypothetical protein